MKNFLPLYLLIFFVAVLGYAFSPYFGNFLLDLGVITETVPISGTGSMYPTFPRSEGVTEEIASGQTVAQPEMKRYPGGLTLFGRSFFFYKLQRGDVIEFENKLTDEISREKYGKTSGFVKRVIALPGDNIELRDGFVFINGEMPNEPYTAKPRSTYGGDGVPDCTVKEVPADSVFVLGDNRKASLDSRFALGFVKLYDIHHVMPLKMQDSFKKYWRNTEKDSQFAHTSTAEPENFVALLNKIRTAKNNSPLNLQEKLIDSSRIRGNVILDTDDFSTTATRSGMTLEKAIKQANYRNIIFAELISRGYFEESELMENLLEFPDSKDILLSEEYSDIGLSAVLKDVNNCPTQVIVIHFGGYKPPNYKKEDIESWKSLIENLTSVLPSWENLRGAENINQEKLGLLLSILNTRLANARKINNRLSNNQWLTPEEENLVNYDNNLHNQAEMLISELNQ